MVETPEISTVPLATPNQPIASNKDAMDKQSKIPIFNSTNNDIKEDGEESLVNKP